MTQVQVDDWSVAAKEDVVSTGVLPVGTYLTAVTAATLKEGVDGKAPQVSFEFTLTAGEHSSRKVWDNCVLTAKALWKLKKNLSDLNAVDALAVVKASTSQAELLENLPPLLAEVLEVEALVTVVHREYNGRTYANVDSLTTQTAELETYKALGESLADGSDDDVGF